VVLAFLAIYVVWGSTYLVIRIAVHDIPPFLMAGLRFGIAGPMLLGYNQMVKGAKPTPIQWRNTAFVGTLMLVCGNGAVCWAEQRVPSGVTALLIATTPLWLLCYNWFGGEKKRPTVFQATGIVLGLIGLALLVLRTSSQSKLGAGVDLVGALTLIGGSFGWASGTMLARRVELPKSPWLANGMEMTCGGALMILIGLLLGEGSQIHFPTPLALGALAYLVVFGSLVALSAYAWLNTVTTPARLGTYAYVNPVVAILLGTFVGGEQFTLRAGLSMALILGAVVLLSIQRRAASPTATEPTVPLPSPEAACAEA